ncbi:DUF1611 domain-containing protein [Paenibacillus silvae]|uniref:DUF1611 domain-containing protein n=1 Tax=Paenibacillus silvae TaxID=1325358 RepID=UPI0020038B7A|nr:DUF1611 domain-containing protein [Paenibacillus silvae]MCK6076577.1 DUF1611 domain-containing protein [Paenibacillus silvae]MCK6151004.1 DUF1611 domain-containing protein [Paenibacillus silvae]MCK6269264.1 DUF1611 domain-containing protein [Paenibacillus silvae]
MKNVAILLEGESNHESAKTAMGLIRFSEYHIVGVIDSEQEGKTTQEVLRCGGSIPFFASLRSLMERGLAVDTVIVGCSYAGGKIPLHMRPVIKEAIQCGLTVMSGLHELLEEDLEFSQLAKQYNSQLIDIRHMRNQQYVSRYHPHREHTKTLLTVGSDCDVGKMTTTLLLNQAAKQHQFNSIFAATGQTGIMIAGHGVPVDRTISDYTIGLVSQYVANLTQEHDLVFVEGQGGILHGNISLGIFQGSDPDYLVLCHEVSRRTMKYYEMWEVPPLERFIQVYEEVGTWVRSKKPAKILGVSLNTRSLSDAEALNYIQQAQEQLKLPVIDPVRYGVKKLWEAIENQINE